MSSFFMKTLLLFIFISSLSINLSSSVAEAARLPGGAYIWYADTLRALGRPGHSPPPYPKPAPPDRNAVVASNLNNEESDDGNIERPRHPPPSYPKPAPPHRDAILRADQLSVLASAYFNKIMATI